MYKHLFFDLDHTLWDFEKNSREVLKEIFVSHKLSEYALHFEDFLEQYYQVTYALWEELDQGKIQAQELRKQRFPLIFQRLGLRDTLHYAQMSQYYIENTPRRPHLMPFAYEVLEYAAEKYPLHILSNGFPDIQEIKLSSSGIKHFFDNVFTIAQSGFKKPRPEMFWQAIEQLNTRPEEVLMIGDNPETDILGANKAGVDSVFYNPKGVDTELPFKHEIDCLKKLKELI